MWTHLFAQIDIPTPTPIPQGTPAVPMTGMPDGADMMADLSTKAVNYWNSFFTGNSDFVVNMQLALVLIILIFGIILIIQALNAGDES